MTLDMHHASNSHASTNDENEHWDFYNPVSLHFGAGTINKLPALVGDKRALLLTTPGFTRRGLTGRVSDLLGLNIVRVSDTVKPNPELADLEKTGSDLVRDSIEIIVAVGGGSVIDTAKVLSVIIDGSLQGFSLSQHLKDDGADLSGEAIPVIAVPTTAGTGSEVTPFATVWDMKEKKKYSLSGTQLFPQAAILDPDLGRSLPRDITVYTGLDAISQAFEAIWNRNATPITTLYATEALKLGLATLPELAEDLENTILRANMLRASLLAGLAISKTRTALAHSMSYPLTMHYGMPHGLACSFTLPAILKFNAEADDGGLERLSRKLGLQSLTKLHERLDVFLRDLGVRTLLNHYIKKYSLADALKQLPPLMVSSDRSINNFRQATTDQVHGILMEAFASWNLGE